ncbi:CsbD family protein [Bradyrhizobium ottawaense]|uniref:CsbD family protein n=1 Tax=Bradyrhizobium ottawaense TaxID=931866 RepID=UPI0029FF89E1
MFVGTSLLRFRWAGLTAKEDDRGPRTCEGRCRQSKSAIKEGAGKLTGDKDLEAEGKMDKAKGSAHNAAGDVKDAARDAADALKK